MEEEEEIKLGPAEFEQGTVGYVTAIPAEVLDWRYQLENHSCTNSREATAV